MSRRADMESRKTQLQYTVLQSSYWMQFCAVIGYASVFLLAKDFSNSQIGMVMALGGILGAVLQPAVAGFADRSRRVELKAIISGLGFAGATLSALLFAAPSLFLAEAGLYALLLALAWVIQPLINAAGMEILNRGGRLNFGLARGIGSLSYAAVSYLLGFLVKRAGEAVVPASLTLLFLALSVVALGLRMRRPGEDEEASGEPEKSGIPGASGEPERSGIPGASGEPEGSGIPGASGMPANCRTAGEQGIRGGERSRTGFFKSYRRFFVLLTGVGCIFICHNILNNYLYQIMDSLGGGAQEMGIAMALAAVLELPAMFLFQSIIKKVESRNLLRFAAVFFTVKAVATLLAGNVYFLYGAQFFQMLSFALFVPASVYYVNELIRPEDRVKGQAFMTATNAVGGVIGSLLGGSILDHGGVRGMLFTALCISAAGTLLMVFSVQRTQERRTYE